MPLLFEWNPEKASVNARKHSVEFAEATSVFSDPLARLFADEEHSQIEQRELIIGHSEGAASCGELHRDGSGAHPNYQRATRYKARNA